MMKRATCASCLRPLRGCICEWIRPVEPLVEVLILQHPLEQCHPKGSARLLYLSLRGSRLLTGEYFSQQELHALLYQPWCPPDTLTLAQVRHPVLLYPDSPRLPPAPPLGQELLGDPSRLRLVILDGTWRKSRKMLFLNPLLQQLPRLSLRGMPASQYLIRKAHRTDQLSTLEAGCHVLGQLEADPGKYLALLRAFEGFVAQQSALFLR